MRQIDLSDYSVRVRNQEEQYLLKDGRGPFSTIQECLDAMGVDKADRPSHNRWPDLPQQYKDQIVPHEWVEVPYVVKDSLIELMFSRDLHLSGPELLQRDDLARKIMAADGAVLLEEAEWLKLNNATEAITGFGKADVELVRRIIKAEPVEVEEKPAEEEATG